MAQIHGQKSGGGFGVLSNDEAKNWVTGLLPFVASKKFQSNIQSSLNDVTNNRGKATGDFKYRGADLLHASSGKAGQKDGCTLFWAERPGNVAKLVAVGSHVSSKQYKIHWRVNDWGVRSQSLALK